jgi:integrase/recombinase XerD
MTWNYWITLFTGTHCVARGLRANTIVAYRQTLYQFRSYVEMRLADKAPGAVTACDVLQYVEHLRVERSNGACAVNRQVTILKTFYRAIVAMGHLAPADNPMAMFPKIKAPSRRLPQILSEPEVTKLLDDPPTDTILGLRDRAILTLLYGTGIRASECSSLTDANVDLERATITVIGKGGHQRTLPLHTRVVEVMRVYGHHRGMVVPTAPFFQSRSRKTLSRAAIYERVRTHARRCGMRQPLSPHKLRHTFATHLVRAGVGLVTIRDLLGHRQLSSTQIYLHVTAQDLQAAALRHPIGRLTPAIEHLLPDVKLPMQPGPRRPVRYEQSLTGRAGSSRRCG